MKQLKLQQNTQTIRGTKSHILAFKLQIETFQHAGHQTWEAEMQMLDQWCKPRHMASAVVIDGQTYTSDKLLSLVIRYPWKKTGDLSI